jgi:hypothetical protein
LEIHADCGQRIPDFVRQLGGELTDGSQGAAVRQILERVLQVGGHVIEGTSHPAHFVVSVNLDGALQVPTGNRISSLGQPFQGRCHTVRQDQGQQEPQDPHDDERNRGTPRRPLVRRRERRQGSRGDEYEGRVDQLPPGKEPAVAGPADLSCRAAIQCKR